jgi:hypothetical protein
MRSPTPGNGMGNEMQSCAVECVLVMDCQDVGRCREVQRELELAGFRSRSAAEGDSSCTRALIRDRVQGNADGLCDETCATLEAVVMPRIGQWKAFVSVRGDESAWATLEGGKPTLRGTMPLPSGKS